jgi:hypothetical protein
MYPRFKIDREFTQYMREFDPSDEHIVGFGFPNKNVVQLWNHPLGENSLILKIWKYDEKAGGAYGVVPHTAVDVYTSEELNTSLRTIRDM